MLNLSHLAPPVGTTCFDETLIRLPHSLPDMDCSLALSLFSLLALFNAGRGAPVDVNKSKIKAMAQNLVNVSSYNRKELIRDSPAVESTTYTQPKLEGLSHVAAVLEAYQNLLHSLHPLLDNVSSVEAGVSMLRDYLKEVCPGPTKKLRLDDLENKKDFPVTVTYEALVRLEGFLNLLLENLHTLRTC